MVPSGRCTASMPDTLPTVTSSTITGEFCGSVATSGNSTVMVYEPEPWPAVPGMSIEFRPPNEQPASSTAPEPSTTALRPDRNTLPRNVLRTIHPRARLVAAHLGAALEAGPRARPDPP